MSIHRRRDEPCFIISFIVRSWWDTTIAFVLGFVAFSSLHLWGIRLWSTHMHQMASLMIEFVDLMIEAASFFEHFPHGYFSVVWLPSLRWLKTAARLDTSFLFYCLSGWIRPVGQFSVILDRIRLDSTTMNTILRGRFAFVTVDFAPPSEKPTLAYLCYDWYALYDSNVALLFFS